MRKFGNTFAAVMLAIAVATACTTTTTRRTPSGEVIEHETTTVDDDDDDDDEGILGTTLGAIGEIIALPFRLVGGLIDAIF